MSAYSYLKTEYCATRFHYLGHTHAAFIACAGAPEQLELTESVTRITACATQFLEIVNAYRTPISHRAIVLRLGVHVGRVLGAVVGTTLVRARKYKYKYKIYLCARPVLWHASNAFDLIFVGPTNSTHKKMRTRVDLT